MNRYSAEGVQLSVWIKRFCMLLFILILAYAITMFFIVRSRVDAYTRQLYDDIAAMYDDDIIMDIEIDEVIPVELSFPVSDLIDMSEVIPSNIPFEAAIPIDTTFELDEEISVPINIPVLGDYILDIPVSAEIPINQEFFISSEIEIDPQAFQLSDETVYITQDIPILIPFEMHVPVKDLGLTPKTEGFTALINLLRFLLFLEAIELEL